MKNKLLLAMLMASTVLLSQNSNFWKKENVSKVTANKSAVERNLPSKEIYHLDLQALRNALTVAPERGVARKSKLIVSFPNSEGVLENFHVFEASVLHPYLAAKYPGIKSYVGVSVDNSGDRIRFSISPKGLQSMRLGVDKSTVFIEPYSDGAETYSVYKRADRPNRIGGFNCSTEENGKTKNNFATANKNADDGTLRTYRIAISTTGEYGSYHGGTVAGALAAINATMTRVNGLYESDFNVTMIVVANTDDVIYTNASSDPYTGSLNSQLQSTLTNTIGEANYDVGHLFHRAGNNGNAGCIGCVCVNGRKGSGFSSTTIPEGEVFDVDYVSHEIGHQFGGNHTWTHGGNEGRDVQMEPGSGSTIMGYAGITGANTDVQQNSDPYFHAITIQQITNYIKTTSCQTNTNTGNNVPVVNAGSNYTIPRGTPFVLTGSATDADASDVLSYCWEQIDENNASTTIPSVNATSGVAFRSYAPTASTSRYFPRLQTIKTGSASWKWETVPNVNRDLNFRLTVRDNRAGGGTNNSDDTRVRVNASAGPFVVNSPNTNVSYAAGSTQTVTWNVAGTTGNGVNAANVDILLSTDGGDTYSVTLVSGVANDGSQSVTIPNQVGSQNRIMVKGSNHIFFDISNANFTITSGGGSTCTATVPTGVSTSGVSSSGVNVSWNTVASATYRVRYRELGTSSWTANNVSGTSTTLSGLSASTQYEVQVRSECTSSNSNFSTSVTFTTTGGGGGGSCESLPYSESFETNAGWAQASGDDGDWVRDSGGTPSSGTGPSSGADGNFYMFLEASSNSSSGQIGANATAILESPCFDLSSVSAANFSFSNHMFGNNVGSLRLEASTNGATWTSLWNDSGSQGNQWNDISVNLNTYVGGTVSLRFVGTTGNGWSSDIAIDNLSLTAGGGGNPDPGCDTLNFNNYTVSSFSNQDNAGDSSIGSGGNSLTLTNNTWKEINLSYNVTANTVIEFEFSSTSEGEIHGVGFENDGTLTSNRYFKVHGTQNYGITNFDDYNSGTKTYIIPVGDSYTGSMDRLVFINDNDGGSGNNSTFSNVKIYETSCTSSSSKSAIAFGARLDVLGDEDENILASLKLAPNPVVKGSVMRVISSSKALSKTSYTIVNMLGQTVSKGKLENGLIATDKLNPGVYLINLRNEFTNTSERFIVK